MNTPSGQKGAPWLANLPPTFFGSVLGISGLGLAWRHAEVSFGWSNWPGDIVLVIGGIILILVVPLYCAKCIKYPHLFAADVIHPVKGPFLAAMPLAILLQTTALAPYFPDFARGLWIAGAALSLGLNFYIFAGWYLRENQVQDFNAIWLIPGVGSFVVAITGAPLGFIEASWFFFSIGLVFWVFLSAVLMYRYIFYPAHIDLLIPSYWVPIVPPGLMSMIYPMLTGESLSDFTRVIYYFALFLTLFNVAIIRIFLRLRFSMGWWAYTFPLDTISSATIDYSKATGLVTLAYAGRGLLIITTFLIIFILIRTLLEIYRGRVFGPNQ
jgi:tellurite resistance protein